MKISIVIPIYNAAVHLQKCLESVARSPFVDLECIMVNDGSTDSSEAICRAYADADRRFIYIQKDHGGAASARNSGISHCRGNYLLFLEPDDYLSKDAWQNLQIYSNSEVADFTCFATNQVSLVNDEEEQVKRFSIRGEDSRDFEDAKRMILASSEVNSCRGVLFNYEIIRTNKLKFQTDIVMGEEKLFLVEYFAKCKMSYISNQTLVEHILDYESLEDSYSISQKIGFLERTFYKHGEIVKGFEEPGLVRAYYLYYFCEISALFAEYAKENHGEELRVIFKDAVHQDFFLELMGELRSVRLKRLYHKIEYALLRKQRIGLLVDYYSCKARLIETRA